MCTDEKNNKDKNKKNLPTPAPVLVFLITEKLLSLRLWNFQSFSLFLGTILMKIERNCISASFFIVDLLKMGREKHKSIFIKKTLKL